MVNLIDGYVVDADKYCYTMGLLKTRIGKDKDGGPKEETYIQDPHYYSSLQSAVQGCVDTLKRKAVQSYTGDLEGALQAYDSIQQGFEKMLRCAIQDGGEKERE